jgi:hypothetical protein
MGFGEIVISGTVVLMVIVSMAYFSFGNRFSMKPPKTVDEAVNRLDSALSLKDKATIARMAEDDLNALLVNLGEYFRKEFSLGFGNNELMSSCSFLAGKNRVHQSGASSIIVRELWKRLRKTHQLRVVK